MDAYSLPHAEKIVSLSSGWLKGRHDVAGIVLVGSCARGTAVPGSDIDLVVLCTAPRAYRTNVSWPTELLWGAVGLSVKSTRDQDYGALWSRHVLLSSGLEVEFGFASAEWATIDPIDPGTYEVMSAGHRILYDRHGQLKALSDYVLSHRRA